MLFIIFFVFSIFFIVSQKINAKKNLIPDILITLLFVGCLLGIFKITKSYVVITFILNLFFFMFGVLFAKHNFLKEFFSNVYVVTIMSILLMVSIGQFKFLELDNPYMKAIKVFISIVACVVFYFLSNRMELSSRLEHFLTTMGKNSLIIYVTHFSFFIFLSNNYVIPQETSVASLLLIFIPLSILLMYFCVFIGKVVSAIPPLEFVFYGVKKR